MRTLLPKDQRLFRWSAWLLLLLSLLVIVGGAYVRATGSGDGCGDRWPSCQGGLTPQTSIRSSWIEWSHRLSSGVLWLGGLGMWLFSRRVLPKSHVIRRSLMTVFGLLCVESLIGAALVVLKLVADNQSVARGVWIIAHLINTFLLLFALALLVWWSNGGGKLVLRWRSFGWMFPAVLVGWVFVGASGAITALGDTLFPAATFLEGAANDFSPTAHLFLKLRIWHPLLAIGVGFLTLVASLLAAVLGSATARYLALGTSTLVLAQILLGFLSTLLLAPIWIQLLHLFLADLIWLGVLWTTAAFFSSHRAALRVQNQRPVWRAPAAA